MMAIYTLLTRTLHYIDDQDRLCHGVCNVFRSISKGIDIVIRVYCSNKFNYKSCSLSMRYTIQTVALHSVFYFSCQLSD